MELLSVAAELAGTGAAVSMVMVPVATIESV